jgi:fido (protein-threonine AMPylation protein)
MAEVNPHIARMDAANAAAADWSRIQAHLKPGIRDLSDYRMRSTVDLVHASCYLDTQTNPIFTPEVILVVHAQAFQSTLQSAGQFRPLGKLAVFGGRTGAEPTRIPVELYRLNAELAEMMVASKTPGDDCVALAYAHARFVAIHPFIDGNGRVGRAMLVRQAEILGLNLDLAKLAQDRAGYIAANNAAIDRDDLKPLAELIAMACNVKLACESPTLPAREQVRCRAMMHLSDIKPVNEEREMVRKHAHFPLISSGEHAEAVLKPEADDPPDSQRVLFATTRR